METGIKVGDCMKTHLVTINETASIIDAAKKMKNEQVGSLLVFDASEKIYGIVTGKDIVYRTIAQNTLDKNVGQIVSTPLVTITNDADIAEAASEMGARHINRLVVISADKNIIGMVSERDLVSISSSLYDLICKRH